MMLLCRDCLFYETAQAISAGTKWPETSETCPVCGSPRLILHDELDQLGISHIDCDAFYASIEKRDDPSLLSRPLIIGGGKRGVVSTACYLARGFGVHSAMPMYQALKLCPEAVVMPPDMAKYKQVSREIRAIFDAVTPDVEPLSIDEAFLDLRGTERLHGACPAVTLCRVVRQIEQEIGITVSVGLSHNKFLAKMASDLNKPRGFSVIGKAETLGFLAQQPISKMWGVGKVTQQKMKRDGIIRIGQLQHMDKAALMKKYGRLGERLYHFSRGEDSRTISPEGDIKSISNEITLDKDVSDFEELRRLLWPLCEKVSARLKKQGIAGRTITLKLKTANFRQVSRSVTPDSPTQMAESLFQYGLYLLRPECQGLEYRLIGIGVSNLCPAEDADQPGLLNDGMSRKIRTERTIDKLRHKFGTDIIKKGRTLS
ncbi:DNA polymerase IV [Luteithermobacter gelatinilyticus]|uniref:DNA polymerase IV n=1 Tax=Luteithermobacter gelatinilyticus TaxID=2582913 RepID=UPI0011071405|nr:DNA polymerase IV [Luteithermobacter gelatinilyticus]